jgi:hypothetical protein
LRQSPWAEKEQKMLRGRLNLLLVLLGLFATSQIVNADNWSTFWPIGDSVSISFVQVNASTYAWKFRNDGNDAITYMKFTYSYYDANSGQFKTDVDYLPGGLAAGGVIGGWTAFSANTRSQPSIQIIEIRRQ